jgi:ATP-dependent Clp protease adaptor protein ClpS
MGVFVYNLGTTMAVDFDLAEDSETSVLDDIDEPRMYNVILYNDDYTTMDFVVQVLVSVYHKTPDEAAFLMGKIHKTGKAVIGAYSYDIAATLVTLTIRTARENDFPLRCEMEMI